MAMISAVCTQCGARLEINSEKESAICPYCDTPFLIEKKTDKLKSEADNLAKSGDTFLTLKEYSAARGKFEMLSNKFPYDYRGWWGLVKTDSKNFTDFGISKMKLDEINQFYSKASTVATVAQRNEMQHQFENYYADVCSELSKIKTAAYSRLNQLEKEHGHNKADLLNQINLLTKQKNNLDKMPSKKLDKGLIIRYIGMIIIIGNSSLNNLDGGTIFVVLLVAGVITWLIHHICGMKLDSNFRKKNSEINEQIRLLQGQLEAEEKHYRDETNSLYAQIKKAGNV
ncbi:MAG: hypothetical protein IKK09_12065 [Clostridia bacterium]|nr:hypothetical protein [Clostridia bacterium]